MNKFKAVWPPQLKKDADILETALELLDQYPLRPVVAQIYAKKCLEERATLQRDPAFYDEETE
jgi:hypothetical protein